MGAARPPIPFSRLVAVLLAVSVALVVIRLVTGAGSSEPVAGPTTPATTTTTTTTTAPASRSPRSGPALPACSVGELRARPASYDDWARTLVDPAYGLKPSYVPPDLVSVEQAGFREPFLVRAVMIDDLAKLRQAAEDAGNPLGIAAAFRSYDTQSSLYGRRVDSEGQDDASTRTARPGHSEHQLGTTVDFKTAGEQDVTQSWEITPAGQWMADNAWRYGFVLSYPKHQTAKTCYDYEPWHFRYFGKQEAAAIRDSGLTVREYLWEQR